MSSRIKRSKLKDINPKLRKDANDMRNHIDKLSDNILNSVTTNNYMRIFALYPKINGKTWFHNINKITRRDL